ncbi:MAG TPA: hypothetical protein VL131_16825, partial [Gammaproteobacteria bacterium]|nr:hypothetical protein [Gammaproteobacteria bacterium]
SLPIGAVGAPASTGILEVQLSRYEIQLADWCNCPSRTTPQGKEKIAELQAKADAVKARLKQADDARSRQKVADTQTVGDSTNLRVRSTVSTDQRPSSTATDPRPTSNIGSLIDLLA